MQKTTSLELCFELKRVINNWKVELMKINILNKICNDSVQKWETRVKINDCVK